MPRTYPETLDFLYSHLPMFQRIGAAAIKPDLHNTLLLCKFLGDPHQKFKTVHVAGSNGKGSVSHMLASALAAAGLKVGLYTSPHLKDFRERIRINGEMISQGKVIELVDLLEFKIQEIKPSFFEVTVAMAFAYFAEKEVDIAIIETGLGGRLDSTNVITPALSVITNISLEHTQILGDTLEKIAGEKAGIIKPGIPVVIGRRQQETEKVFREKAVEQNSAIYFADELELLEQNTSNDLLCCAFSIEQKTIQACTDLTAIYQAENLRTAVRSLQILSADLNFSFDDALKGIAHTQRSTGLKGRWQKICNMPRIFVDGAHNPDGISHLVEQINREKYDTLHIVFGAVRDKDVRTVLQLLPRNARYYFTQPDSLRALPQDELKQLAAEEKKEGNTFPNAMSALNEAKKNAGSDDLIVVTGSLFLVGEVA